MSRLGPEPRINSRLLDQFKGQTVRLTAKVIKLSGDTATVEASDGGQVGLHLSRDMHLTDGYYEIIGNVKEDKSVKALTSIELGPNLDMKSVNALVELSNSPKGQGVLS